jgi:fructan beta-fructosidase
MLFHIFAERVFIATCIAAAVLFHALPESVYAQEDLIVADFEGNDYGAWKSSGKAFGDGPAHGTLPGQMQVEGYLGKGLVNSFFEGDGATGELISPEFTIERNHISFLIGGGMDLERTCMQLLVSGKVVRVSTGNNSQAGGSEALLMDSWDVAEFRGKPAVIRIIDQATGGWGHINVDQIVQTDRRPPGILNDAKFSVPITGRYLHVPIKNGAPKRVVKFMVGDKLLVRNDIELATGQADWWAVMDVEAWKGKSLVVSVDKYPGDATGLSTIFVSDKEPEAERLYEEELRGQIHFSPKRGWNNDPNGLVYFNGEYHLFFQHNPYGWGWGNMHWGHAVSRDLVHWEELGDKLLPDEFGPMFSGSAVVDWQNSSGLGKDGKPPMVLFYTAAGDPTVQCLAYSLDGRTFTKYAKNPIVPQITGGNRDPKVFWYEPTKQWVMVLYVTMDGGKHTVHILTSKNLLQWEAKSIVEGEPNTNFLYECPDFFELGIDGGDVRKKMWVLLGANSEYGLGTFDGSQFLMQEKRLTGHCGRGFYAAQTFSDISANDGRRIMIGWFQTATPGMSFNQSMTIPLELGLKSTANGPRLTFLPVQELRGLRKTFRSYFAKDLEQLNNRPILCDSEGALELRVRFAKGVTGKCQFTVRGIQVVVDFGKKELLVHDHTAKLADVSQEELILYVDRQGLEVFASEGLCYVPLPMIANRDNCEVRIDIQNAKQIEELQVFDLKSIWK